MTREEAYFERILLLSGFWEGYDEWLGFYLENEEPLSDIVLELIDCKDIKAAEHRLGLYCEEKPFDEESVHERLRIFLCDSYKSGKMTKDIVLATMGNFSHILTEDATFSKNCRVLFDYYDLVEERMISEERFEAVMLAFLERNERVDTDKFWKKVIWKKVKRR